MPHPRTLLRSAIVVVALACVATDAPALAQAPGQGVERGAGRHPLLMDGKKTLFQRVLTRPGAALQESAGAVGAGKPLPPFSVFYVYGRSDQGGNPWIEVGASSLGQSDGWIAGDKLLDWKQTLTVAFTNPAGRDRVLFLRDRESTQLMISGPQAAGQVDRLRAAAIGGNVPADSPVVAIEPENFVDINRQFYLLPILSAEPMMTEKAEPLTLLEVASVTAGNQPPPVADRRDLLAKFNAGVVFVLDTTMSMDPYIDRSREAMRRIYDRIRDTVVRDKFRFGLVTYRNNVKATPALEYVTKVVADLKPDSPPEQLLTSMRSIKAATVSSSSFYEDPFAGLKAAIDMDWSAYGGRYIILVTDAGGRSSDDPLGQTGLGPGEIRRLAKEKGIAIFALHLLTEAGRNDHARARAQYVVLTDFDQAGPLYYPVPAGSVAQFGAMVDRLADNLLDQVSHAAGVPVRGQSAQPPADERNANRLDQQAQLVGNAMRLAYLGRQEGTRAPELYKAWTTDHDFKQPETATLEVRVLLTKNQLSDLQDTLKLVLEKGRANRLSPENFFTQLKAAAAATSRDPQRLGQVDRLGNVLGEYLDDLPYHSQIMELGEDEWRGMGAAAQTELLNGIEAKLRLYTEFHNQPQLWVSFDGSRVPGDAMFPVPLDALP